MDCATAQELLLEAEVGELRGEGDSALAGHLRGCPTCQAQAQTILAEYAVLRAALERAVPQPEAAEARRQARARLTASRRWWKVAVPMAIAAGAAGVYLVRSGPGVRPAPIASGPEVAAIWSLDVQGAPGRTVAVFQTENPNIIVIWSF